MVYHWLYTPKNGKFYVGVGCHDNDSLVNMAKDTYKRELHLEGMKKDYDEHWGAHIFSR